jgi:hypothetical protein
MPLLLIGVFVLVYIQGFRGSEERAKNCDSEHVSAVHDPLFSATSGSQAPKAKGMLSLDAFDSSPIVFQSARLM